MWGLGILEGMVGTMRNMLRGPITLQYPEQKPDLPPRARWTVTPVFYEDGTPKCTACLICVKECPDHILHLEVSTNAEGGKHIDEYTYELGACMMCGLCVEACPFQAIEMSHEYELAVASKGPLVRRLLQDVDAASPRAAKAAAKVGAETPSPADEHAAKTVDETSAPIPTPVPEHEPEPAGQGEMTPAAPEPMPDPLGEPLPDEPVQSEQPSATSEPPDQPKEGDE